MYECALHGHPDKLADILADSIVDFQIIRKKESRVACEVVVAKNKVVIAGEINDLDQQEIDRLVRETLVQIGYKSAECGICPFSSDIRFSVSDQSKNLNQIIGASLLPGDQSIVVGYATAEHSSMLPLEVYFGKLLAKRLSQLSIPDKFPDGKLLVCSDRKELKKGLIRSLFISCQHAPKANLKDLFSIIYKEVDSIADVSGVKVQEIYINPPSGVFDIGGPVADTGVTGRKLIADAYGPRISWGGGALSGKDPTKIDRSGAYGARYVARSLVASGLAKEVVVLFAYSFGQAQPERIEVYDENGENSRLELIVRGKFDVSLQALIEKFDLFRPIFRESTENFHFGINADLPWEKSEFI